MSRVVVQHRIGYGLQGMRQAGNEQFRTAGLTALSLQRERVQHQRACAAKATPRLKQTRRASAGSSHGGVRVGTTTTHQVHADQTRRTQARAQHHKKKGPPAASARGAPTRSRLSLATLVTPQWSTIHQCFAAQHTRTAKQATPSGTVEKTSHNASHAAVLTSLAGARPIGHTFQPMHTRSAQTGVHAFAQTRRAPPNRTGRLMTCTRTAQRAAHASATSLGDCNDSRHKARRQPTGTRAAPTAKQAPVTPLPRAAVPDHQPQRQPIQRARWLSRRARLCAEGHALDHKAQLQPTQNADSVIPRTALCTRTREHRSRPCDVTLALGQASS